MGMLGRDIQRKDGAIVWEERRNLRVSWELNLRAESKVTLEPDVGEGRTGEDGRAHTNRQVVAQNERKRNASMDGGSGEEGKVKDKFGKVPGKE